MAAIVRGYILQAAGRIALRFRVFAQLDQQAANFRHVMALQGGERENIVTLISIRQRAARAKIGLNFL